MFSLSPCKGSPPLANRMAYLSVWIVFLSPLHSATCRSSKLIEYEFTPRIANDCELLIIAGTTDTRLGNRARSMQKGDHSGNSGHCRHRWQSGLLYRRGWEKSCKLVDWCRREKKSCWQMFVVQSVASLQMQGEVNRSKWRNVLLVEKKERKLPCEPFNQANVSPVSPLPLPLPVSLVRRVKRHEHELERQINVQLW